MDWSHKKVLIAEDEITNYILLQEYLEPTGIQLFHAVSGRMVLEILENITPDLILLDMKMPEISGFELVKKLREAKNQIPIIAQTAYSMKGDKEKFISAGCDDYISKPISEDILLEKMRFWFNSSREFH